MSLTKPANGKEAAAVIFASHGGTEARVLNRRQSRWVVQELLIAGAKLDIGESVESVAGLNRNAFKLIDSVALRFPTATIMITQ